MNLRNVMLVLLLIWGVGWVAAVSIVAWRTGDVPGALLAAGPSGLLGIVVAFQNASPTLPVPESKPKPEEK